MSKYICKSLLLVASSDLTTSLKLKPSWSCVEKYNRLLEAKLASTELSNAGGSSAQQSACPISLEGLLAFARRFFSPRNLARVQLYVHGNCAPEGALAFAEAVDERLVRRVPDDSIYGGAAGASSASPCLDGAQINNVPRV